MMCFATKAKPANRRFSNANVRLNRKAATCVEMAMVAPFILAIGFGSIEFSRVVMVKQALTSASREGCRLATLGTTRSSEDVEDAIRDLLRQSIRQVDEPDTVVVTITPSDLGSVQTGEEIHVQLEVQFADVSWFKARWSGSAILTGNAVMIRE